MKADDHAGDSDLPTHAARPAARQPFREPGSETRPPPSRLVVFAGLGTQGDRELAELLARAGMRGVWLGGADRALAAAAHARFDAAVLAIDEPMAAAARHFDTWRRTLRCPLLVLADGDDEVDEIIALELGADGVLPRRVTPRRLRAHLLMLTRAAAAPLPAAEAAAVPPPRQPQAEGWALDRVLNRLGKGAREVELTETQAALLQVLMDDAPRVVPRARLLGAIPGGHALHARSIDVYVARLRQRLRERHVDELQIHGVRGRGYALVRARGTASEPIEALRRWHAPLGRSGAPTTPLTVEVAS